MGKKRKEQQRKGVLAQDFTVVTFITSMMKRIQYNGLHLICENSHMQMSFLQQHCARLFPFEAKATHNYIVASHSHQDMSKLMEHVVPFVSLTSRFPCVDKD